jgi:Skp family chaperone for outer membrane proteins
MKSIKMIAAASVFSLSLLGLSAQAQTDTGTPTDNGDKPRVTRWQNRKLPERPKVELPADLKAMVEEARKAAADFRAEQAELVKSLKDATAEERAKIRADLKELRETFLAAQKDRMKDIRARLAELRKEFQNKRDEVLGAAKEQGKKGRGR